MENTEDINKLTAQSILSEDTFAAIFDEEDEIFRARMIIALEDKAKELGVKTKFAKLLKGYNDVYKKHNKARQVEKFRGTLENWTNFSDGVYNRMKCFNWIADDDGIRCPNPSPGGNDIVACQHPVIPIGRMKNLETGEEQIRLAYKRNGKWTEIITKKGMIAAASRIVNLSDLGVAVTSENAKYLVRYLCDVECQNEQDINIHYSSSRVGWINGQFLPYDKDIIFDGENQFRQLYQSIRTGGSREAWYEHVKVIRASGRLEPKMMLAASFASVLLKPLGLLPFVIDLWGDTEGGKTVTLMLAASVWADPRENQYIGDFQSTDVAFEAKANMLNSFPLILDDTAKVAEKWKNNFETLVYNLCSGKGKSRSNKELGTNRENHWENCTLTSGEAPLINGDNQGGAINRVLELQAPRKIFDDPQLTADTLKANFGWAGMDFIQIIKEADISALKAEQRRIQAVLEDDTTMQKQTISLSVILLADKLITERLFRDGNGIDIKEARQVLADRNYVSMNQRCYEYLQDKIMMNPMHFYDSKDIGEARLEQWGMTRPNRERGIMQAIIIGTAFDELCKSGGYNSKSFLSWAKRHDLIETDAKGNPKKNWKNAGAAVRSVFLKLHDLEERDAKGRPMFE